MPFCRPYHRPLQGTKGFERSDCLLQLVVSRLSQRDRISLRAVKRVIDRRVYFIGGPACEQLKPAVGGLASAASDGPEIEYLRRVSCSRLRHRCPRWGRSAPTYSSTVRFEAVDSCGGWFGGTMTIGALGDGSRR